jgi:hypothetical protein
MAELGRKALRPKSNYKQRRKKNTICTAVQRRREKHVLLRFTGKRL